MKNKTLVHSFLTMALCAAPTAAETNPKPEPAVTAEHVRSLERRIEELEGLLLQLKGEVAATRLIVASAGTSPSAVSDAAAVSADPDPPKLKTASAGVQAPASDPSTLRVYWKEGLRLDNADESFKLKIGGRIMTDFASLSADKSLDEDLGALRDGFEFRRARLGVEGTIHNNINYKAEYDFTGDVLDGLNEGASFNDVYIGVSNIPVLGQIRIGHQKEPFSLEELASSRHVQFMERASGNAFVPSRNTGVVVQNTAVNKRINLAAGYFKTSADKGTAVGDGGFNLTARAAGTPIYRDGGRTLVHLGLAYSRQNSFFNQLLFRERPEAHLAPRFVNTGVFAANKYQLMGLEGALVAGRFSAQGEYIHNWVDAPAVDNPRFNSSYIQGSFFLTGEHRRYSQDRAAFDRIRPTSDFFNQTGGYGAWQILARYSRLDLNSGLQPGGEMNNLTLGLNWYLNPNTRWTFNYVRSDVKGSEDANIFQMRFFVDF